MRSGEVAVAEQLFYAGASTGELERAGVGVRHNGVGYTWACVKTAWWDNGGAPHGMVPGVGNPQVMKGASGGKGLVLEVGVAVLRCANRVLDHRRWMVTIRVQTRRYLADRSPLEP